MSGFRKNYTAIWVGNISHSLSQEELNHVFEPLGSLQLQFTRSGESRGWGFLCTKDEATADRVYAHLKTTYYEIRGRTLDVGDKRVWATEDSGNARTIDRTLARHQTFDIFADFAGRIAKLTNSVYVSHLPPTFTKADVFDLFSAAGKIVHHQVGTKASGDRYAFVDFANENHPARAVEMFDNKNINNSCLYVEVASKQQADANAARPPVRATIGATKWPVLVPRPQPQPAKTLVAGAEATSPASSSEVVVPVVVAPAPPDNLNAIVRALAPNLQQIAYAVNAAEGLTYVLSREGLEEKMVGSELVKKAVKALLEKMEVK